MTQCEEIALALLAGERLTPLDALYRFGCMRLAPRILELKARGLDIETEITVKNGEHFATYYLRKAAA